MNGRTSKLLRLHAQQMIWGGLVSWSVRDSKRLWRSLPPNERGRLRRVILMIFQ